MVNWLYNIIAWLCQFTNTTLHIVSMEEEVIELPEWDGNAFKYFIIEYSVMVEMGEIDTDGHRLSRARVTRFDTYGEITEPWTLLLLEPTIFVMEPIGDWSFKRYYIGSEDEHWGMLATVEGSEDWDEAACSRCGNTNIIADVCICETELDNTAYGTFHPEQFEPDDSDMAADRAYWDSVPVVDGWYIPHIHYKGVVIPTEDLVTENEDTIYNDRVYRTIGRDRHCWKDNCKARKQWGRHMK